MQSQKPFIRLYPGAYAFRAGEKRIPRQVWRDKHRSEIFHVGPDLYFDDGTPAAPAMMQTPAIVEVISRDAALALRKSSGTAGRA